MHDNALIQGRAVSVEDLGEIRALLSEQPAWHRTLIYRELYQRWEWCNEAGRLNSPSSEPGLVEL